MKYGFPPLFYPAYCRRIVSTIIVNSAYTFKPVVYFDVAPYIFSIALRKYSKNLSDIERVVVAGGNIVHAVLSSDDVHLSFRGRSRIT